ncbi:MAG: dehydrogenase, partial [Acidobacteria bacterium]|nr:dehydrogenase [Acidobacteriota bacterium]
EGNVSTPDVLDRYDAIFAMSTWFKAESVRGCRRLAIVARWGVGYDRVDTEALTENGIALAITPNAVRTPVAEAILTLMLALAKNLFVQSEITRAGKWRGDLPALGRNLRGQVLGSIGCGNIGKEMFRLARPFGFARMLACDPFLTQGQVDELGVELVDMDTVMRESDFVTVNALLNERTQGLVDERSLRLMKPTAYFINTARGPIVDQEALIRLLRDRAIAGAGLDVFEVEPPPKDLPLLHMDNVIVTPHGLPWTEEIARDNGLEACDNILAVASGNIPPGLVNRAVADSPLFKSKLNSWKA